MNYFDTQAGQDIMEEMLSALQETAGKQDRICECLDGIAKALKAPAGQDAGHEENRRAMKAVVDDLLVNDMRIHIFHCEPELYSEFSQDWINGSKGFDMDCHGHATACTDGLSTSTVTVFRAKKFDGKYDYYIFSDGRLCYTAAESSALLEDIKRKNMPSRKESWQKY